MSTGTISRMLVDSEKGLIDRKIFVDDDIYQQELEQIYGRCWLFLGHESQIPNPNDFFGSRMGEDPVLLTRDARGKVHGFLNMCRHRGNRVCRADLGNSPSFMCTYHGWTFASDGKLVGVPGYKEAYFEELDRSQWGLVEVAQISSYKGLVFATWDPGAPSLLDYLGDMAWYLDVITDNRAGGSEFVKGSTKAVLPYNWKYVCDNNGGDGYHSAVTHRASDIALAQGRGQNPAPVSYARGRGRTVHAGNGHCVLVIGGNRIADRKPTDPMPANPIERYHIEHFPERVRRLGEFSARNVGSTMVFTLFPNFSEGSVSIRVPHPGGPYHTEAWNWTLTDKDAPDEVKAAMRRYHMMQHGPSGIREEEDLNNFMDCTRTAKSLTGQKYLQNLQLGLGHEDRDERFPGFASPGPNEVNQRFFYKRWAEIMDASSWSEISIDPVTHK